MFNVQELRSNYKPYEKYEAKDINRNVVVRFAVEPNGTVFVFAKGARSKGRRFSDNDFCKYFEPIKAKVDANTKWHRACANIIKHLKKSGLWTEICGKLEQIQVMSYEEYKAFYDYAWGVRAVTDNNDELNKLFNKYPFMYDANNTSRNCVNFVYIDSMFVEPKTKSMNFGYRNAEYKAEIAKALAEHREYSTGRVPCNYDVTFSYQPKESKAWYSEEYKGCGNGHYYLALDESMALFCEDD